MSTLELRRQAKKKIDRLSGARLRAASDILSYLQQSGRDDATAELLQIPGFVESFVRGRADAGAGRVQPWRKVRRDV